MKIFNGKRVGAIALAVMLGFNGAALTKGLSAKAETVNTFTIQTQKRTKVDVNEYLRLLQITGNKTVEHTTYDNIATDAASYTFLKNIEFIDRDTEKELIDAGYIFNTDVESEEFWLNFDNAESFVNRIMDYNHQTIKRQLDNKKFDISELIDISDCCADPADREYEHQVFVDWFNAYSTGLYESEYFQKLFDELTSLSAPANGKNAYDTSVGSRYTVWYNLGTDVLEMMTVYACDKNIGRWTFEQLKEHFIVDGSTIDIIPNYTPDLSKYKEGTEAYELAKFARYYYDLDRCVRRIIYNDIYNFMGARCVGKAK